ncbi:MAG: FAD-binding oxidoreductase [Gammaproteobacteria bacterium]|nr:FAD-binding oxidoreductase [Gammaproteobacteria bacterium]
MTEPHAASYYAATVNAATNYPQLAGSERCDVAIIGGGFSGVATALSLAERGYDVILMEQNKIGWGASGRNGGQLINGFGGAKRIRHEFGESVEDLIWEMGWQGHKIIATRIEKYGIQCDYKPGYMEVAVRKRQVRELEEDIEYYQRRGLADDVHLISKTELPDIIGTSTYLGGLINNKNGHLHPLNLCIGEAQAAAGLGVRIFEETQVLDVHYGEKPVVSTATGNVEANSVVIAGNAYHHLDPKRFSGLIFPAGSYIIATEPLTEAEARELNPLDLAVADLNNVLDYFRLSADKRMIFGGRCNYSGRAPKNIKDTLLPRLLKIYPQLAAKSIDYEWGGDIGIVINRVPLIRRWEKNVFSAMGYSGHGVNVTHLAGDILADAIAGSFERLDVFDRIEHFRVPFSRWFGNQVVALGMLYYRMKDLL